MFLLLIYAVSAIAWGLVFWQLSKTVFHNNKHGLENPPLLIPLAIATFAILVESIYFGGSAYFIFFGHQDLLELTIQQENWMIPKLLIAFSGILLFFKLKKSS